MEGIRSRKKTQAKTRDEESLDSLVEAGDASNEPSTSALPGARQNSAVEKPTYRRPWATCDDGAPNYTRSPHHFSPRDPEPDMPQSEMAASGPLVGVRTMEDYPSFVSLPDRQMQEMFDENPPAETSSVRVTADGAKKKPGTFEPLGQTAIVGDIKDAMVEIRNFLHGVVAAVQCPVPGETDREGAKENPKALGGERWTAPSRERVSGTSRRIQDGRDLDDPSDDPFDSEMPAPERGRSRWRNPKLPPFDGSEAWEVLFNRFEDVATRYRWSDEEKLDALLPRLQGKVGEFVCGQLRRDVRNDYRTLSRELKNRFRKVETTRTYGSQFSRRVQLPNESVEEFAGELKRLYDKGHPRRDPETRREDLLRRFFDGLHDEETSFQVEYVKEPIDIDEAVFEMVNYVEIHRRQDKREDEQRRSSRRPVRVARAEASDSEESVARLPAKPTKTAGVKPASQSASHPPHSPMSAWPNYGR